MPLSHISLLRDFVESLKAKDAIFKRSVLEGIDAVRIQQIPHSKWRYYEGKRGLVISHGNSVIALDDETAKDIAEHATLPPEYVKSIDSLFFGNNILISRYGRIALPGDITVCPSKLIPPEIKAAIFIAVDEDGKRNFLSMRENGNGEFQWGYLFGKWGSRTQVEQTGTGAKLSLIKKGGGCMAELLLPELTRNENVENKAEYFIDPRDGKKYRIVTIGNQTWFAENLNWEGAGVAYKNKKAYGDRYGRLYTWNEAMLSAPAGWHLPTDDEWRTLKDYVASDDETDVADELMSEGWNGTDEFGFSALPGGFRGFHGTFCNIGESGFWWTATKVDSRKAYIIDMGNSEPDIYIVAYEIGIGASIRLVRD